MSYTIIDTPTRISAEDGSGVTIVGAQMPKGEVVWKLYMTDRLTDDQVHRCHPVVCSREGALQWVDMIASLYSRATAAVS
jgi:hypothetical protein